MAFDPGKMRGIDQEVAVANIKHIYIYTYTYNTRVFQHVSGFRLWFFDFLPQDNQPSGLSHSAAFTPHSTHAFGPNDLVLSTCR